MKEKIIIWSCFIFVCGFEAYKSVLHTGVINGQALWFMLLPLLVWVIADNVKQTASVFGRKRGRR